MSYTPLAPSMEEEGKRGSAHNLGYPTRTRRMFSNKGRLVFVCLALVLAGSVLSSLFYRAHSSSSSLPLLSLSLSSHAIDQSVHEYDLPLNYSGSYASAPINSTFGFEKVFVLNLPKRVDRQDEMTLLGYASDIKLEFVDAVTKADYEKLSIGDYAETLKPGVIGCFRSHVNVLRRIVAEGIETALILEDDVDWDVDIRKGLERLQDPLATLVGSMKKDGMVRGPTEDHPYGENDWDVLYLGACMELPWVGDIEKKPTRLIGDKMVDYDAPPYLIYEDDTAPDSAQIKETPSKLLQGYGVPVAEPNSNSTIRKRVLQRSRMPICTASYAVTRRGAARLLYIMTRGEIQQVDWVMGWAAGDGRVESYSVVPPLMDQWTVQGNYANSDINGKRQLERRIRQDVGISDNIRNSMRSNLEAKILPPHDHV